jgi:predicted metal-dependent hydrolase
VNSESRISIGPGAASIILRRSRSARTLRLRVDPRTAGIILTIPHAVNERRALAWADTQRGWIEARLAEIPAPSTIVPGAEIPLYGEPRVLVHQAASARTVKVEATRIVTGGPAESLRNRILRWLRRHALDLLSEETAEYAVKAGVAVPRVGVGDPVSRWGSCSASGSIRYSWRLILAPAWVRRATVAHEVAHLVHLNHGAAFHRLVAQLLESDPAPARAWLRREGASLHRFGRA